jgi:hypothetical protein
MSYSRRQQSEEGVDGNVPDLFFLRAAHTTENEDKLGKTSERGVLCNLCVQ